MKRKLWKRLLLIGTAVLTFVLLPLPVFADMGPKPSVRIAFENFGDGPIYGTLRTNWAERVRLEANSLIVKRT